VLYVACIRFASRIKTSSRRLRGARSASPSRLPDVGQPRRYERRLVQGRPSRRTACAQGLRQRQRRSTGYRPWWVFAVWVCVYAGPGAVQLYAVLTARCRSGVAARPATRTRCVTLDGLIKERLEVFIIWEHIAASRVIIRSHILTCHPTEMNAPRLNSSQTGRYSTCIPRRDERLSWHWCWLYTWMVYLAADSHPSL